MTPEELQLIDTRSAMKLVDVKDERTLLRMCQDGEFPKPVIDTPRRRRWSLRTISAWMKRREAGA